MNDIWTMNGIKWYRKRDRLNIVKINIMLKLKYMEKL